MCLYKIGMREPVTHVPDVRSKEKKCAFLEKLCGILTRHA